MTAPQIEQLLNVDLEDVIDKVKYITPVPGGVGPMTISCLLRNTVMATAKRKGVEIRLK